MDEILPNLYLGNLKDANNRDLLKAKGITHVLSIIDLPVTRYPDLCIYKKIEAEDVPNTNLTPYFRETNQFIEDVL